MTGATLNPTDLAARQLLEKMLGEFLPLFDSPFFNANADETYHLGKGKSKAKAEEIGVGRLYLNHIKHLDELTRRYNRRMMVWGDVVKSHPELIP